MSSKKGFMKKKKKRGSGELALQITSMADIFMILLVFLLKSYSTSLSNIAPTAHLALPEVEKASVTPKDSLKIEVAKDIIMIDDKPVLKLSNFEFSAEEQAGIAGSSPTITRILNEQRKRLPEANMDSGLVVMADEGTPYSTLKRVVASAAGSGFVDLQLLVVDPQ